MDARSQMVALVNEAKESEVAGDRRHAAELQGRAIEIAHDQKPVEPRRLAVLYLQLGGLFERDNEVQKAVRAYELGFTALTADDTLELRQAFEGMFERAVGKQYTYVPLSETVNVAPDLYTPQAEADLEQAVVDPLLPAKLLINIGNAYLKMPQPGAALHRYQLALDRPEMAGAEGLQAVAHTHIGLIHSRQGEVGQAVAHLEKALEGFAAAGDTPGEQRRALVVLASLRYQQGEGQEARALYEQALPLYRQAGDILGEQRALANLGQIEWQGGSAQKAEQVFLEALALQPAAPDRQVLAYLHWGVGQCQEQRGEWEAAAASLEKSLEYIEGVQGALQTDEGKVAFLDSVQEVYDALIRVRLHQAQADAAHYPALLALIDRARGRAFRDLLDSRQQKAWQRKAERRRSQAEPQQPFNMMAQTALSAGNIFDSDDWLQPAADPEMGETAFHNPSLEGEAGGDEPEADERRPPDPRPMARLLFYVLPEKTVVLAVAADGRIGGHVLESGEAELVAQIGSLRAALDVDAPPGMDVVRGARLSRSRRQGEGGDYRQQLGALYTQLVAPLEGLLPAGDLPLVIEPHGPLWLLPFAALLDGEGRWLVERAPLLTVPAYHVLQEIRREPDFGPPQLLAALLAGNPTMPAVAEREGLSLTLRPLPGAAEEATSIAALFTAGQHRLLLGDQATATAVLDALPTHQIIHLATHGVAYADDPNASFIALAADDRNEGPLDVRAVLRAAVAADLVVLSACQTGLGKISGDGVIGLGRAFLAAGARSVLVSQWNVSDRATAVLMARFYHYYLERNDKALALQEAMQEIRQQAGYEHPRFWAPFMLIGADV